MKRSRTAVIGSMIAMLVAAQAHAEKPAACITPAEVESVALVLLPDLMRGLNESCAAYLPATALLSQRNAPMIARYDAEVDSAWPGAREALLKIANVKDGKQLDALMDVKFGRTFLAAFVVPGLVDSIKPEQCGTLNRMVEMFEPLPARNVAGIFSSILQLAEADKKDSEGGDNLNICPLGRAG